MLQGNSQSLNQDDENQDSVPNVDGGSDDTDTDTDVDVDVDVDGGSDNTDTNVDTDADGGSGSQNIEKFNVIFINLDGAAIFTISVESGCIL